MSGGGATARCGTGFVCPRATAVFLVLLLLLPLISGCRQTTTRVPAQVAQPWQMQPRRLAPPPPERLPQGAIVRVISSEEIPPRFVILDEGSGLATHRGPEGWYQYGVCSWYGPRFHGRRTANGETYDQMGLTAAHRDLPFGSIVRVTNLHNGRSCVVRINDRGPYLEDRIIDVSRGVARQLGMENDGIVWVRVDLLREGTIVTATQ